MSGTSLLAGRLLAVLLLVLLNGFFVATEFSLVRSRKTRIDQLASQGSVRARAVQRAMGRIDAIIAATQLGITMASLGLGYIGEPAIASVLEPLFGRVLPHEGAMLTAHGVALVVSFAIATTLHIVLGELVPKNAALQRAEGLALWVVGPMDVFMRVFRPAIAALQALGNVVLRLLGLQATVEHSAVHSVEELELLVHSTREAGLLEEQQERMVAGVFDFAERQASRVMTPRTELEAVPAAIGLAELAHIAAHSRHSRLPVYEADLDHVVGAIHAKDVLRVLEEGAPSGGAFDIHAIMRPIPAVPESLPLDELMAVMRRQKSHLAIVIDEFGGTAGMVTLEDLLEEIVGEVQDEFDLPREPVEVFADGSASLDGLLAIEEVNERLALAIDEPYYDTIGGYVFGRLGRKPELGDEVQVDGRTFVVEQLDGLRIARLRLLPPAAPASVPSKPAE